MWVKYPSIEHLHSVAKLLLRKNLVWTLKEDGSNISIWMDKDRHPKISSRNLETASADLVALVKQTSEYDKVVIFVSGYPNLHLFVEACRKGRSITGAKEYAKPTLFLFDIFNTKTNKFIPFKTLQILGHKHGIPTVEVYKETKHSSLKDILKFRNHALEHCKVINMEGMVVKTNPNRVVHPKYNPDHLPPVKAYVQAKTKIDIPLVTVKKIARGEPVYPHIPENEVMGAIDKVWVDIGTDKFKDKRVAMPLVARAVSTECKKHSYSLPPKKLFHYYQAYILRHLTETE